MFVSIIASFLYCFLIFCFQVHNEKFQKANYEITQEDFDIQLKEYVKYYNYTYDQTALMNAVSFMYSPWSQQGNKSLLRQGLIDVSLFWLFRLIFSNFCNVSDDY